MSSEVEIGVWVEGTQKWISGVTRRTTCHDLIKALLKAQNLPALDPDINNYVIVERWRKVERPLDHEQRILKVWKTWGEAIQEVRFTLRKVREEGERLDSEVESRTERSRRRRRKSTQGHHHHAKDGDKNSKKAVKEDSSAGETMDRLMRLVLAQGETIQAQLRRLQERDQQIETYEQQMHLLRVKSIGSDYLLHSYLKDPTQDHSTTLGQGSVSPKDDLICEETSNDSGVVTEEGCDHPCSQNPDGASKMCEVAEEVEEVRLRVSALESLESILSNLIEQELYLSNLENSFIEIQDEEVSQIKEELSLVSKIHSQTVSEVRQNEAHLRELDTILFHRKSTLDSLLEEELKLDDEIISLEAHLEFIMHLPPSAFTLEEEQKNPKDSVDGVPPSGLSKAGKVPESGRVPSENVTANRDPKKEPINNPPPKNLKTPSALSPPKQEHETSTREVPPPLPSSSPPPLDIEEETLILESPLIVGDKSTSIDSDNNGTNSNSCSTVSSESSTSEIIKTRTCLKKCIDPPTKDGDSTDSNSDTGLSSLHSSSDEGVMYTLDTLV